MPERVLTCRECGKEMSSALNVCPECGYVRRRTRATREQARRAVEPSASQVVAVTDAVRSVPRREPKKRTEGGRRARSRRHQQDPAAGPAAVRHASRYSTRSGSARLAPPGTEGASEDAAEGRVRELSRRKVYRYGQEKRKRSGLSREMKALIIMVVGGLCLVLMCQMQQGNAAEVTPSAAVGAAELVAPHKPIQRNAPASRATPKKDSQEVVEHDQVH